MGKTGRWLRSLLSSKKSKEKNNNKKASKSSESGDNPAKFEYSEGLDANKHAIAVAAATAAVAEAALAAAQAAAEVVKLTSGGGGGLRNGVVYLSGERRRVAAAVRVQSAFRAYLARRALRALKALVKLQALVRGHIVRKQSADMLRRMQAMARIQARASATRAYPADTIKIRLSNSHHQGAANLRKYGEPSNFASTLKQYNPRLHGSNSYNKQSSNMASEWLDQWMERGAWSNNHDDEWNAKVLEIDTWKPLQNTRRSDRTLQTSHYVPAWNDASRLSEKLQKPNPSISSEEVASVISEKFPPGSPQVHSASSRPTKGPFTPTRSEYSRSFYGDYLGHPSYMSNTESSRAKVRSQSAPKQRMQLEELGHSWKFGRSLWESDVMSEKGTVRPFNYKSNSYLNSGNSRRAHEGAGSYGFSSSYGHRL